MAGNHYTCPYCQRHSVLTDTLVSKETHALWCPAAEGLRQLFTVLKVCANPDCRRSSLEAHLFKASITDGNVVPGSLLKSWFLLPPSNAIPWPDYVPAPIRADYEEACLIRRDSPKAAATLARRCLQGMIRDFWGVSKPRLQDEINAIKDRVQPEIWEAIEVVRKVGNVGAHMEKDVNVIVDVDEGEAGLLIGLIETLIKEWYVARRAREDHLAKLRALGTAKEAARKEGAPEQVPLDAKPES